MIEARMADGSIHRFPDNTPKEVIDRVAKEYAAKNKMPEGGRGFVPFATATMAKIAGAPTDLVHTGLQQIPGLKERLVEEPFGGEKSIRAGLTAIGSKLPPEGAEPETIPEYLGRGFGEGVGFLVPGMGAAKVAGRFGKPLVEAAMASPLTTAATEAAAGTGAGAARYAVEKEFPDNPYAQFLAEFAGGVAGGTVPSAAKMATKYVGPRAWLRGGKWAFDKTKSATVPFTESGAKYRASERLRDLAANAEEAAKALETPSVGGLSAAVQTGDKRLMALEQVIRDADPTLDAKMLEQATAAAKKLRSELEKVAPGSVSDTRAFMSRRAENLQSWMDGRVSAAAKKAQDRLEKLDPAARKTEESVVVRDELESAYKVVGAQEDRLWARVPKDAPVEPRAALAAYNKLIAETPRAQYEDIPYIARQFLDPESNRFIGLESNVNEVWGLRSKLLEIARTAKAKNDRFTAKTANEIASALLDDLGATPGKLAKTEAGERLREALDFTALKHRKFSQGSVGKILGWDREGGLTVAPETTLDVGVGRGGTKGAVAVDELNFAMQSHPADTAMTRYVTRQFVDAATDKAGKIDPVKARKWMKDNEDILDKFPEIGEQMKSAEGAQALADRTIAATEARRKRVQNPNTSFAADFLKAEPGQEIDRVFKSSNPTAASQELRKQISKDKTGKAAAGFKNALVDHLIRGSETAAFTEAGEKTLSGRRMLALLRNDRTRGAYTAHFSPDEMQRLEKIATELAKLETAAGRLPNVGGVVEDLPNSILAIIGRVSGAQVGRRVAMMTGGGTVQTPGIFSGRAAAFMKNLTNDRAAQLLNDAVQDPELFRALLMPVARPKSAAGAKMASVPNKRLNSWLAGPGSRVFFEDDDEPSPPIM